MHQRCHAALTVWRPAELMVSILANSTKASMVTQYFPEFDYSNCMTNHGLEHSICDLSVLRSRCVRGSCGGLPRRSSRASDGIPRGRSCAILRFPPSASQWMLDIKSPVQKTMTSADLDRGHIHQCRYVFLRGMCQSLCSGRAFGRIRRENHGVADGNYGI